MRDGGLPATIVDYAFLGRTVRLEVELESGKVVAMALPEQERLADGLKPGTAITLVRGRRSIVRKHQKRIEKNGEGHRRPGRLAAAVGEVVSVHPALTTWLTRSADPKSHPSTGVLSSMFAGYVTSWGSTTSATSACGMTSSRQRSWR